MLSSVVCLGGAKQQVHCMNWFLPSIHYTHVPHKKNTAHDFFHVASSEPGFRCASTASSALATPGDSQRHLAISASTFGCYLSTSGLRSPGRPGLSPLYAAGTPPSFCGSAAGSPGSPLQTSGLLGQSAGSSFNRVRQQHCLKL